MDQKNEDYLTDEEWAEKKLRELFEVDKFEAMGRGDDKQFQALVFLGRASQQLSLARTIINDNPNVFSEGNKNELSLIQEWVHSITDKIRENK